MHGAGSIMYEEYGRPAVGRHCAGRHCARGEAPQLTSSTSALEPVQAITRDSSMVACSGVSERVSSQRFSATAMPDVPAAASSASS